MESSLNQALKKIRSLSSNTVEQGTAFEKLAKIYFENDDIQKQAKSKNCKIVLPVDVVCARNIEDKNGIRMCDIINVYDQHMILDVGEKTTFTPLSFSKTTVVVLLDDLLFDMEGISSLFTAVVFSLTCVFNIFFNSRSRSVVFIDLKCFDNVFLHI